MPNRQSVNAVGGRLSPWLNGRESGRLKTSQEPAVGTRENFDIKNYDEAGLEKLKLADGIPAEYGNNIISKLPEKTEKHR